MKSLRCSLPALRQRVSTTSAALLNSIFLKSSIAADAFKLRSSATTMMSPSVRRTSPGETTSPARSEDDVAKGSKTSTTISSWR